MRAPRGSGGADGGLYIRGVCLRNGAARWVRDWIENGRGMRGKGCMNNSEKSAGATSVVAWQALLAGPGLPELGPGPRAGVVASAVLEEACAKALARSVGAGLAGGPPALLARGAVLLWHDQHEAAHGIAQEIASREGSWLHGMLHRREPDFSNAAYWYQRVGQHPAFAELARRAGEILEEEGEGAGGLRQALFRGAAWSARGFIDACEQCAGRPAADARRRVLERIQAAEIEVFLEHVWRDGEGDGR